jgi:putative DNA-invertase from lambdoid prophage Rac
MTADSAMAVYSYTRVSTGRQADEGESLGAQQRRVDGYAQMNDLRVDRHFVERGVSGSIPLVERPQGAALLDLVTPGDVIITPKLDRCFRSALDALDVLQKLKARGVSLHMIDLGGDVTGNGISKLLFTILSAVAEAERDRIRERITDVKRDQRQRGRYLGGRIPFGFRVDDDGALIEAADQQAAIRDMLSMRSKGASLRSIAEAMKRRGLIVSHNAVREITARARLDAAIP